MKTIKYILCVCDHGQVRSVAMAHELCMRGYMASSCSALAIENDFNSADINDIHKWDLVINMSERGKDFNLIGRDEWGDPTNYKLKDKCRQIADTLNLEGTE